MILLEVGESGSTEIKNLLDEAKIKYTDTSSQSFGAVEVVCSIVLPITIAAVQTIRGEILARKDRKEISVYLDGDKVSETELSALLEKLRENET